MGGFNFDEVSCTLSKDKTIKNNPIETFVLEKLLLQSGIDNFISFVNSSYTLCQVSNGDRHLPDRRCYFVFHLKGDAIPTWLLPKCLNVLLPVLVRIVISLFYLAKFLHP